MSKSQLTNPGAGSTHVVAAAILVAALVACAWPQLHPLVEIWRVDETYSHGPLVIVVFGYVAWIRRRQILPVTYDWLGVVVMLVASAGLVIASLVGVSVLSYAVLPIALFGICVAVFGRQASMALLAPVLYLYLALPIWGVLTGPLQFVTSKVVMALVVSTGIPAFIQGNVIQIASGVLEISDGCAGTATFIAATALASFIAMLSNTSLKRDLALVSAALLLAVVGNWVRVYSLVLIGYRTQMTHDFIVNGHATYSWLVFTIFMIPVFWYGARAVSRPDGATPPKRLTSGRATGTALTVVPAALAALVFPMLLGQAIETNARSQPGQFTKSWPATAAGWSLSGDDGWQPRFENADFLSTSVYERDGVRAHAYLAGYAYQTQGKEADYFGNQFYPARWLVSHASVLITRTGSYRWYNLVSREGNESVLIYRFFAGSEPAIGRAEFKWNSLWQLVTGNPGAGAEGIWFECGVRCDLSRDNIAALASELTRSRP